MSKEVEKTNTVISNLHPVISHKRTLGQKTADILTNLVGNWIFIIVLIIFLIIWILTSGYFMLKYTNGKTDPYPFILLNLILACITAIQAPIILMSQKRQAERDRLRAEYDYEINKKAEKEIREIKEMLLKMQKGR